jgi:hypothetical protein
VAVAVDHAASREIVLRGDIVAAGYRAQRFVVHVAPLDRFAELVRGLYIFALPAAGRGV